MEKIMSSSKMFSVLRSMRCFHTSNITYSEGKTMKKILHGSSKKRKHRYFETPMLQSPNVFTKGGSEGKRSVNYRRVAVLNKLFMRHITDLMATGESANELVGYGIEISRVEVTSDFNAIHVFWLAKGMCQDNKIENLLQENAYSIRHELSQLKVIGAVPKIKFMKDKQLAHIMEVDLRLSKADFGEDYEPTESTAKLKTELQLLTKLEPHLKEKINKLGSTAENEEIANDVPPMPQNVLGLDHEGIMLKVKKVLKKSSAPHRTNIDDQNVELPQTTNLNPVEYSSTKAQNAAFKEFLQKRTIMRLKFEKNEKNLRLELDLDAEWDKAREREFENFNFDKFLQDEDYVEEDDKY